MLEFLPPQSLSEWISSHLLCWTHAAPLTRNSKVHHRINTAHQRIITRTRPLTPNEEFRMSKLTKNLCPTIITTSCDSHCSNNCSFHVHNAHGQWVSNSQITIVDRLYTDPQWLWLGSSWNSSNGTKRLFLSISYHPWLACFETDRV